MKLLILSTPRTGSNALCECLTFGETMGHVDGYFVGYGEGIQSKYAEHNHNFISNHSNNGNFGTKVMWDYLDHIAEKIKQPGLIPEWLDSFSHVLWLTRRNVAAQAVSWYMALGSGKWTSANEQKREWPEYDYQRIAHHVGMIAGYDARTESFLDTSGACQMHLTYEQISEDWPRWTGEVFDFCGLKATELREPILQRQENPLKAEFIQQFNRDWVRAKHARKIY